MNVLTVDFESSHAPNLFCESLRRTGFAVIKNHPIAYRLVEQVYADWEAFFASGLKFQYLLDKETQDGYIPASLSETAKNATTKDLKEFYHLYFPWGRYPSSISELSKTLFNQLFQFAKTLLGWIEDNTPKAIFADMNYSLQDCVGLERTLFRILHYPAIENMSLPAGAVRAAAHEDINLLTVLPAATEPGLQVLDLAGNWHDVESEPGTLVINVGDMLQECSQHHYRSTTHRVINPEATMMNKARMSMPLFLHPKKDAYLSAKYPQAEMYLNERLHELGLTAA